MGIQRYFQGLPAQSLLGIVLAAAPLSAQAQEKRFYSDDPICCAPKPLSIKSIEPRKIDLLFDFIYSSVVRAQPSNKLAGGINTLGEVLDSEWFTNRHARKRMTPAELKQGPGDSRPPQPPYVVIGAKLDGITPGFRMKDAKGVLYFIKPDPRSNPEMATAADVIGSRFLYAIGYNTPENYIINIRAEDISIDPAATRVGDSGKPRPMVMRDIRNILWKVPRAKDGSYRMVASTAVDGKPVGPFEYLGTRSDDPNDVVPHEQRRDLRGLFVFCAWLNHTDAKSGNSLDAVVTEGDLHYVRHYLIDFGSAFGSDSDMPKNARFGNGYIIPTGSEVGHGIANLGVVAKPWEKADYPDLPAIGRFESKAFQPKAWIPNYPNPAFDQRTPEDEYWAAKIVMAFSDDDIRAIVETAQYSDPAATDYMVNTLKERRDKIGRAFFGKVLPLEDFHITNGALEFRDLAVVHGFTQKRQYNAKWFNFDNQRNALTPIPSAASMSLPGEWKSIAEGNYLAVALSASGDESKTVTVYLRKTSGAAKIVGIDRMTRQTTPKS